jgi:predicted metal-dependent hydrolase
MPEEPFEHGIALFNRSAFFDAHEVLEDVWRAADGREKRFLQGLIQIAVGFHHLSTGNAVGARSLLNRGAEKMHGLPAHHAGIDVAALRESLARWLAHLDDGAPKPPFPRL